MKWPADLAPAMEDADPDPGSAVGVVDRQENVGDHDPRLPRHSARCERRPRRSLVVDIGGGRFVVLAHLEQGSVTVQVGDVVRRGRPLAAIGNSGRASEPHLQIRPRTPRQAPTPDPTFPMVFRDVHTIRAGVPGRGATAASS